MQSSFLLHRTNHGIRKGFSRLYMTSGEGDARPVPLFPVDHDNSAAITDHAHICKFTVSNITLTFHKSAATDFGKFIEPHRLVKSNGFRRVVCCQLNLANMAVSAQNGL